MTTFNTFTKFDAEVTTTEVFKGFVGNSIGRLIAFLSYGRSGTAGVYVPTISGAGVTNVSSLLGFSNRQTISAGSVLVQFDKYKGSHFVIGLDEQSTTDVNLMSVYAERTGAQLAFVVDQDLLAAAVTGGVSNATASTLIAKADVADVFEEMNARNVPMSERVWVFDPEGYADVIVIDEFIRSDARGDGTSAVVTGSVGSLLGAPVFMSNAFPSAAKSLYVYKPALALAINRDLEVVADRTAGNFGFSVEISMKYGVKVIDGNGIGVFTSY